MANNAELTGLIVKIKGDLTDYKAKLDAMQGQTARGSANVASKFDAMDASMAKAGVAIVAFAATAVNSAMAWGSAIDKLAKQTGMSAEESSKILVIAKKASIDIDTANIMFAKLAKSISSATKEQSVANATGKISSDIFTQLGVKTLGHRHEA